MCISRSVLGSLGFSVAIFLASVSANSASNPADSGSSSIADNVNTRGLEGGYIKLARGETERATPKRIEAPPLVDLGELEKIANRLLQILRSWALVASNDPMWADRYVTQYRNEIEPQQLPPDATDPVRYWLTIINLRTIQIENFSYDTLKARGLGR